MTYSVNPVGFPSRPSLPRLTVAVASLLATAGAAWGQDSTATALGGNDALSPYEPAHQRRSYVVDLVSATTSWGRRVAVGPVLKASRALEPAGGATPPTNLLGSTAVGPGVVGPVSFASKTFALWNAAGQGAHPTLNAAPGGSVNATGFDRQFCLGATDFALLASGSVPTNISGAIIGQNAAAPRRLFVERTYALVSRSLPDSEDTASLALGAADPSGNVYVRGDEFLSLFPNVRVLGENVARVALPSRDVTPSSAFAINFLLKELLGPANQGWDNASTSVLVNTSSSPLVCPTALPQHLIPGQLPVFGNTFAPDFAGVVKTGSVVGSLATVSGFSAAGVSGLRGNPSFSITTASLNGLAPVAAPAGTVAMLAVTAGGTAEQKSLAPITSINVAGLQFASPGAAPSVVPGAARLATLPTNVSDVADPDAPINPPPFLANTSGSAQFTHCLGQVPFRGPSGQVAIGQLPGASGDLLVAATARDASAGDFIAVKRFVSGSLPTSHWVIAARRGSPVWSGPSGASIGALAAGSPVAISSPAMDLLGNVYFVARWQPTAAAAQTGLFKAVLTRVETPASPTASGLTYRLELLLTTGQSVTGANSATPYTITALRLADSNGAASGGFHAGQIVQSRMLAPGETVLGSNPEAIHAFGGVVVNATIEYAAAGGAQRYEAALFVAPGKTLAGDANNDGACDFADLNLVLSFFGQSGAQAAPGDVNNDGVCDFPDLNLVLSDFGSTES